MPNDNVILSPPDSLTDGVTVHVATPAESRRRSRNREPERSVSGVGCGRGREPAGACTLAPAYKPPATEEVANFKEAG